MFCKPRHKQIVYYQPCTEDRRLLSLARRPLSLLDRKGIRTSNKWEACWRQSNEYARPSSLAFMYRYIRRWVSPWPWSGGVQGVDIPSPSDAASPWPVLVLIKHYRDAPYFLKIKIRYSGRQKYARYHRIVRWYICSRGGSLWVHWGKDLHDGLSKRLKNQVPEWPALLFQSLLAIA